MHLDECFEAFAILRAEAERPGEVAIALWFHDAVYDTRRKDNERRSATLAAKAVRAAGGLEEATGRVHALVMATRHDAVPEGRDAGVLVDADLGVLGSPRARFEEYERQVRREYGWVPDWLYRRARRKVLGEFLARPGIYATGLMRERFEERARENLGRSLKALKPA